MAGKVSSDENGNQKLTGIRDRGGLSGGLWNVREEVVNIFLIAERSFKSFWNTARFINNFNWQQMVSELVTHPDILSNFNFQLYESELEVTNEFELNLLENILAVHIPFPILMVKFNTTSLCQRQQRKDLFVQK